MNEGSVEVKRVLFYSHDTLGLGHFRRTLLICRLLGTQFRNISTLILTGSAMAHGFRIPPGVDYVKLPCVTKIANEVYGPRFLDAPFDRVAALREEIIFRTTAAYSPDFFFVDNVPLGMKGELLRTLKYLRENSSETRIFLNLRDVVDAAEHVGPLWARLRVFDALEKYYDRIFVYGDPSIYDPITEYGFPSQVREKASFCGYIPREANGDPHRFREKLGIGDAKFILVTVGGGSDGVSVVESYLRSVPLISSDVPIFSVVLLGPEMECSQAADIRSRNTSPAVRFVDFTDEPLNYMAAADLVISMGGYNTVSEILALGKKAIAIPRGQPRQEQLIRVQRLDELGLLRMVQPSELSPERLAFEVKTSLNASPPLPKPAFNFSGIQRLGLELQRYTHPPGPTTPEHVEAVP